MSLNGLHASPVLLDVRGAGQASPEQRLQAPSTYISFFLSWLSLQLARFYCPLSCSSLFRLGDPFPAKGTMLPALPETRLALTVRQAFECCAGSLLAWRTVETRGPAWLSTREPRVHRPFACSTSPSLDPRRLEEQTAPKLTGLPSLLPEP